MVIFTKKQVNTLLEYWHSTPCTSFLSELPRSHGAQLGATWRFRWLLLVERVAKVWIHLMGLFAKQQQEATSPQPPETNPEGSYLQMV